MSAPSAFQLQRVMTLAMATLASLREDDGLVLDTDAAILAELAGADIDVETILRRLTQAALDAKAAGVAADLRIADLRARRERFLKREASMRETILAVMEALALTTFADPEFTMSITPGKPKVVIVDEDRLTDAMVMIKVVRTPDKAAIKAAIEDRTALIKIMLEQGEEPPPPLEGVTLSNGQSVLTIRTK